VNPGTMNIREESDDESNGYSMFLVLYPYHFK
jgi:hypothetical protein